jgi:hypothetical protein
MISSREIGGKDIVVHVDTEKVDEMVKELQASSRPTGGFFHDQRSTL